MRLNFLNLKRCGKLTDQALLHLLEMPLDALNISNIPGLTDMGLKYLHGVPLSDLTLTKRFFSRESLSYFVDCGVRLFDDDETEEDEPEI